MLAILELLVSLANDPSHLEVITDILKSAKEKMQPVYDSSLAYNEADFIDIENRINLLAQELGSFSNKLRSLP